MNKKKSFKNRIKELRVVKASDLIPNPQNWRKHPPEQISAMKGILSEIGYTDALIGRETAQGVELLDGHLRQSLNPDQEVPVLIVDLNDEEARLFLTVFDPIANMAETDTEILTNLMEQLTETNNEDLDNLLEQLAEDNKIEPVDNEDKNIYTKKVTAPIYEPKNEKPPIRELVNNDKTSKLLKAINNSSIDENEKEFLRKTATRHMVFDYSKIADYYAHSNKEVQSLMENSALVIIDFDKAIEEGYTLLSKEITEQYKEDYDVV